MTRCLTWCAIAIAVVAVYWQVWSFDFVNLDDGQYVYENSRVSEGLTRDNVGWAWTTFSCANWHPLTWLSFMADTTLYGPGPAGHHVTNLLLHIANAILLLELLRRVTGETATAFVVALLFALHPVHVESVAWISERKGLLSIFFGLISIRLYVESVLRRDAQWYAASLVAFGCSLLAKQVLVTLPCLFLVLDVWPLGRMSGRCANGDDVRLTRISRLLLEKLPYFGLTLIFCVVTLYAQGEGGAITQLPLTTRLANASLAYLMYLRNLIAPSGLAPFYPYTAPGNASSQLAICGVVIGLATSAFFLLRRKAPWLVIGWLWYLGTLVPVIGLIQVGNQSHADRYLYFPAIGIYIAIVWGGAALMARLQTRRTLGAALSTCVVLLLLGQSFLQARHWQNSIRLWSHTRMVTQGNARVEAQLGLAYLDAGDMESAEPHLLRALEIDPDHASTVQNYAVLLFRMQRYADAGEYFADVVESSPEFAEAHMHLAVALWLQEQYEGAENSLRESIRIKPELADAHYLLGKLFVDVGRYAEARASLQQAARLNPSDSRPRQELLQLSQKEQAAET